MDADEALIAREVARLTARGTDQDIAVAALLVDVPVGVAVAFIRDGMFRALGGAQRGEYWLRIQELNFLAHQKRRADARTSGRRWEAPRGPWPSVMGVVPDD